MTKKKEKLKLYVWEDVLCDYTCGMAFAIAHNREEAGLLATKHLFGPDHKTDHVCYDLYNKVPDEYDLDTPIGFAVYGGG